ncbi:hypothetical protein KSF_058690 [Reticulibacter mediterranei]|uniref:Uncharacterized protein n=1 Tax=Reticulibacter mediterranei TaxID=2778369 RepID=A0A8J3ITB1_9CHLR|nr:hypothetical protein KSF_058690 [Reticulibacter mediterranei]
MLFPFALLEHPFHAIEPASTGVHILLNIVVGLLLLIVADVSLEHKSQIGDAGFLCLALAGIAHSLKVSISFDFPSVLTLTSEENA